MGAYTVNNGKIFGLMGFNKFLENTITFSSNNDSIEIYETKIIEITRNGTGAISIVNNNPSVIEATLSGNTITITGLTKGNASITVNVARDIDYDSASATYNCESTTLKLNNVSWSEIKDLIQAGHADYFEVGDTKDITLDLPASTYFTYAVSGTYKVVVLGINHNSELEGTNRVHFCIGQDSTGKEIAFFARRINASSTSSGGWNGSEMKTFLNDTFYNALPTELKDVITACTKYTDNTGNKSNTAANVTSTSQKIWLMAEFEVFGSRTYASNQYERNKQKQYDYYKNGNSKVRYKHSSQGTMYGWWLRSPCYVANDRWCKVNDGGANNGTVYLADGVVPCFTIS